MSTPKIVLLDIETLPAVAATFTLYPTSINHENILQDWSIICICWKILNKPVIYATSVLDDDKAFKKDSSNDYVVISKFREVLSTADVVVGHNIKKFDMKKFNARLIYYNLEPLPEIHMVDTLTEIKKVANFMSHRLDYLGNHLLGDGKVETSRGLWLRVLKGDKKAVKEMVSYCKRDVELLEELYNRILPYMKSHPHVGAMQGWDRHETCPKCGSDDLSTHKTRYTAAGIQKAQKQCKSCHSYTTFNVYKTK